MGKGRDIVRTINPLDPPQFQFHPADREPLAILDDADILDRPRPSAWRRRSG